MRKTLMGERTVEWKKWKHTTDKQEVEEMIKKTNAKLWNNFQAFQGIEKSQNEQIKESCWSGIKAT